MEEVINKFLSVCYGSGSGSGDGDGSGSGSGSGSGDGSGSGSGSGSGDGYGYGYGYGSGDGYGDGDGDGYGDGDGDGYGDGYGYGYGDGDGDGIKEFNHQKVYMVDNTPTLIDSVHSNYAIGKILNNDLTTTTCYIAKVGNFFAHGNTLKEALTDAQKKYEDNKPVEERIADFINQYPSLDSVAEHSDLYRWHNTLTGSCTFGRDAFARDHNLDKDNGTMTVREFINLTRNAYGGDIIRQLEEAYK